MRKLSIKSYQILYTHYQRHFYVESDAYRIYLNNAVRLVWHPHKAGFIIYSNLTQADAESTIAREIDYFKDLGYDFEWKYFDYDKPDNLPELLEAGGLEKAEEEAVMILPIPHAPSKLLQTPQHDIRKVTTKEMFLEMDAVYYEVWKDDPFSDATPHKMSEWLLPRYENDHDNLSIYLAYVDGKAVSYGRVEYMPDNPFASIWGGSTLAEYRRRGIYTDMVAVRLQEARARGCKYLTVDARQDTSMPILQKLGFIRIATATAYNWSANMV